MRKCKKKRYSMPKYSPTANNFISSNCMMIEKFELYFSNKMKKFPGRFWTQDLGLTCKCSTQDFFLSCQCSTNLAILVKVHSDNLLWRGCFIEMSALDLPRIAPLVEHSQLKQKFWVQIPVLKLFHSGGKIQLV